MSISTAEEIIAWKFLPVDAFLPFTQHQHTRVNLWRVHLYITIKSKSAIWITYDFCVW